MQTTIQQQPVRQVGHMVKINRERILTNGDNCGNLTADHPAIRAQIAEDSKKFREITDLRARGLI